MHETGEPAKCIAMATPYFSRSDFSGFQNPPMLLIRRNIDA